jgi:hypothetical protein
MIHSSSLSLGNNNQYTADSHGAAHLWHLGLLFFIRAFKGWGSCSFGRHGTGGWSFCFPTYILRGRFWMGTLLFFSHRSFA